MKEYCLDQIAGFEVLHNSAGWRTAVHCYRKDVNSIDSVKEWGIHVDSEEAFILLCGKGVLAAEDKGEVRIAQMKPYTLYVVGEGQRHAIALNPGTKVLIMENRDMSRFQSEKMELDVIEHMRRTLKQSE